MVDLPQPGDQDWLDWATEVHERARTAVQPSELVPAPDGLLPAHLAETALDGRYVQPAAVPTAAQLAESPELRAASVAAVLASPDVPKAFVPQQKGITRPVISGGKLVANFGAGVWTLDTGTPTLTQGYTGFDASGNRTGVVSRTGQPEMLRFVPSADTAGSIVLTSPSTNIRHAALNGQFGLWVYIENQPGFQAGVATTTGIIGVILTTAAGPAYGNSFRFYFDVNQLREGWNFLKFVQRNPAAYRTGGGATEYHPYGLNVSKLGDGTASDIVNQPITGIKIDVSNLGGATLYFDSIWTGIQTTPQVVLGVDLAEQNTVDYALPALATNGWIGYTALTGRLYPGGSRICGDINSFDSAGYGAQLYEAGWEVVNHSLNHLPGTQRSQGAPTMRELTSPAEIRYEVEAIRGFYEAKGWRRGLEFYASPGQSTSRLAQKVIKDAGYVLQRHARKVNTPITPWGVDNLDNVGATPLDSPTGQGIHSVTDGVNQPVITGAQVFSKIKRVIDVIEAYGDSWFAFCHTITTLGDSGSGEDLTGNDIIITRSAFQKTIDYLKAREDAGALRVRDGMTGFYYGIGR